MACAIRTASEFRKSLSTVPTQQLSQQLAELIADTAQKAVLSDSGIRELIQKDSPEREFTARYAKLMRESQAGQLTEMTEELFGRVNGIDFFDTARRAKVKSMGLKNTDMLYHTIFGGTPPKKAIVDFVKQSDTQLK